MPNSTSNFSGFEKQMIKLLLELPPRSRTILKKRYGLGEAHGMTLEAIGKKESITRERVRQIENDALRRLKKSPAFTLCDQYGAGVISIVDRLGGVVSEQALLSQSEFQPIKDKKYLLLFLELCDVLGKRKGDDHFHTRWYSKHTPVGKIENAVLACANELASSRETLTEADLYAKLATHFKKAGIENTRTTSLATYTELAKSIQQSPWGEYGHEGSPFVRPRGMRESAFVALSRAASPLHFQEIAKRISEFSRRPVHVQTVHNELIKDPRFVLVGRGLYALREWGYEPGFVKDVLVRLLEIKGALSREEILTEVSRVRKVKPSTIFINLQNKKLFKALDDGTYTLVS